MRRPRPAPRISRMFGDHPEGTQHTLLLWAAVLALWMGGCTPEEETGVCEGMLPLTCEEGMRSAPPKVIQHASAFVQGNGLYARAELDPIYLEKITPLLRHGEPILATYRFRLYRLHDWLPGLRLSHVILKRRLRLRLITQRFEMLDVQTGQIQYTANPEDAMEFLGAPHYVFLGYLPGKTKRLSPAHTYRLNVELTIKHEGTLHVFRVLDHWPTFGASSGFSFHAPYTP